MQDIVVGVLGVVVGSALCFQGYWALRVAISLWGGLAGFSLGAGAIASPTGDTVLSTLLGWFVAVTCAVVFAVFAYLYYAVAVILAMGSAGATLGSAAMVALDSSWTWIPAIVGALVGLAVALAAIMVDLPTNLLVFVAAAAGSSAVVTGIMLLTGRVSTADFDTESITRQIDHEGWWALLVLFLFAAGIVSQSRRVSVQRTFRQAWSTSTSPTTSNPTQPAS